MKLVDLNSLDREKTYYHFTPRYNYESICEKRLLAKIGSNANGIEKTPKVFFAIGNLGFLKICDVWINWFIYKIALYDNVLKYNDISIDEKMNLKRQFKNRFIKGAFYSDDYIIKAFEMMRHELENDIMFKLNLDESDYDLNDIDEAKSNEREEFINRMYLGNITSLDKVESFNMHTKSNLGINNDKIEKIICENNDSALYILKEIYNKEKQNNMNLKFVFLDKFIEYVYGLNLNVKSQRM